MSQTQLATTPAAMLFARLRALFARPALLLALLAGQFALLQLLSGVQYGDAARNLHWGLLTFEQPAFLIGAPDTAERIKGFPPDPVTLAPRAQWDQPYSGLHGWWGPLPPLLFATVWGLTRSYLLLQLVVPLAAAGVVLLTYRLTRSLAGPRAAMLAAAFLACYPLFRDYATVAYTEPISALALTAALAAYLGGRTALCVLFGAAAALCKMDMLAFYTGVVGLGGAYSLVRRERSLPVAHYVAALLGPLLLAAPWVWLHYLRGGAGGPTEPLSTGLFAIIFPQLVELTFYIPWYGALITLVAIGAAVLAGLRARALPPLATVVLGSWLGLGLLVTLVYCATPGAGNSPRIFLPALPALAVLFGSGFPQLPSAWRRRIGFYLVALFVLINSVAIGYQVVSFALPLRQATAAFAGLRTQERGFVLTPLYWETALYTRQPVTWFEADPQFERNIMHDAANFARYIQTHPIRYVLLAKSGDKASPTVRAYLAAHARAIDAGTYTLYVLQKGL
jgi:hypothetical protein